MSCRVGGVSLSYIVVSIVLLYQWSIVFAGAEKNHQIRHTFFPCVVYTTTTTRHRGSVRDARAKAQISPVTVEGLADINSQ